jgi:hypothetical protein
VICLSVLNITLFFILSHSYYATIFYNIHFNQHILACMSVVLSLVTKFNLKIILICYVFPWIILNIIKAYISGKHKEVWRIIGTSFINIAYEHDCTANSMENSPWEPDNRSACQQIPCTLWNTKFHYRVHKDHILGLYLSQFNSVHTILLYDPF